MFRLIICSILFLLNSFDCFADNSGFSGRWFLDPISVISYSGVDATGVSDSSAGIMAAMGAGNKNIYFPCGVYLISSPVYIPSNIEISGAGECSVLKMASNISTNHQSSVLVHDSSMRVILTNNDWSGGGNNIYIHDLYFDGTLSPGNAHLISFGNSTNVVVENNVFVGTGADGKVQDGVSFIKSSYYRVLKNRGYNIKNTCFDQWNGSHDFVISHNVCDGGGGNLAGVLINGISSQCILVGQDCTSSMNTTYNGVVENNNLYNNGNSGINVTGLSNSAQTQIGVVDNILIKDNIINGVSKYYGIIVGDAKGIVIKNNRIINSNYGGICIGSRIASAISSTSKIDVIDNTIDNANISSSTDTQDLCASSINIVRGADHVTVSGNTVTGSAQRYGFYADNTTSYVSFIPGKMSSGVLGIVLDHSRSVDSSVKGEAN